MRDYPETGFRPEKYQQKIIVFYMELALKCVWVA
jgi:hypothetical protein